MLAQAPQPTRTRQTPRRLGGHCWGRITPPTAEIHDELLMSAKQAVTPALTAQRQMDERAKRPITDEHGVARQIRMYQGDLRHVMRTQGSGQHFADIARAPLARQQHVSCGEATTG